MIQAGFVFPLSTKRHLLESILRLPGPLQPARMSVGEDEPGSVVFDDPEILDGLASRKSGFFLKNGTCSYDVNINEDLPITLSCFVTVPLSIIRILMTRLAESSPIFGFACLPEEREAKNRVTNVIGVNTIDSWVGRDIDKSLPGLYWWTLISASLAEKHGISLAALSDAAVEHIEVHGAPHLFRFYETPDDWRKATEIRRLTATLPGIFDVERAREALAPAKTFLEHSAVYRRWT